MGWGTGDSENEVLDMGWGKRRGWSTDGAKGGVGRGCPGGWTVEGPREGAPETTAGGGGLDGRWGLRGRREVGVE